MLHQKATGRNKIKRRMREAYRSIKKSNIETVNEFESIIFIARPAIIESDYIDIYKNIELCLQKAVKRQKEKHVKSSSHNINKDLSKSCILQTKDMSV